MDVLLSLAKSSPVRRNPVTGESSYGRLVGDHRDDQSLFEVSHRSHHVDGHPEDDNHTSTDVGHYQAHHEVAEHGEKHTADANATALHTNGTNTTQHNQTQASEIICVPSI